MGKKRSKAKPPKTFGVATMTTKQTLLASVLILSFAVAAAIIESSNSKLYYALVQEDGTLEWMTFWAFILAAVGFALAARRQQLEGAGLPWLTIGLALFSFVVAMEEISWGQRVLGYRPPEYFLEQNFQQEFNVHNVLETGLRKLGVKATILGFGVVLPLLALSTGIRRLLQRHGPVVPPLGLIPAFLVTYWIYDDYPWRFSGEIVELMLGLGFLFSCIPLLAPAKFLPRDGVAKIGAVFVATFLLGYASYLYSRYGFGNEPELVEAAEAELEALASDFRDRGRLISKCGNHKRVFSWAEKYDRLDYLSEGRFSGLVEQGLPEARAGYFIDPWNTPYWIRHKCSKSAGREIAYLYSFGPNRRRNSTQWELLEDDIGVILFERGLD